MGSLAHPLSGSKWSLITRPKNASTHRIEKGIFRQSNAKSLGS
jgi:hypothetical protein